LSELIRNFSAKAHFRAQLSFARIKYRILYRNLHLLYKTVLNNPAKLRSIVDASLYTTLAEFHNKILRHFPSDKQMTLKRLGVVDSGPFTTSRAKILFSVEWQISESIFVVSIAVDLAKQRVLYAKIGNSLVKVKKLHQSGIAVT
jgi:hypothetical protein